MFVNDAKSRSGLRKQEALLSRQPLGTPAVLNIARLALSILIYGGSNMPGEFVDVACDANQPPRPARLFASDSGP